MTSSPHTELDEERRLDERYVQNAFHSFLKSSLAQAKAEHLLDVEVLSGAEGDLMITGPALCLYFAALRCTTNPPSVPLPRRRSRKEQSALRYDLSLDNCPVPFIPFLRLWSECVPTIQGLVPEHQHDLARIICSLPPLFHPVPPVLGRLAADLRSISIEISQRRSFQDRYASDLQAVIDVGDPTDPGTPRAKASFVPPPMYTPSPTTPTFPGSVPPSPQPPHSPHLLSPSAYSYSPSRSPSPHRLQSGAWSPSRSPSPVPHLLPPNAYSPPRSPSSSSPASPLTTPTIATTQSPAIELIRETLYAALADVLASTPSLLPKLASDPPRAYFAAVSLAILAVASSPAVTDDGTVLGVRGVPLTLAECPAPLRPLMRELAAIRREAAHIEEEDTREAIRLVQEGREVPAPRLERARILLERGPGADCDDADGARGRASCGRRSVEGRAVAFANRVNALALAMTRLPQFRERQDDVFKVLAGVGLS
ncbi:hypothetical protein BC826DRAFT_592120 [Russula brevipes]|nr:hypothetical protein BC826DRAFT_592120 [Russula brevipes]